MQGHKTYGAHILWLYLAFAGLFACLPCRPASAKSDDTAKLSVAESQVGLMHGIATVEEGIAQLQHAIFAFNFLRADSICQILEANYPNHYLSHFARAHYTWWLIITMPESAELENIFREHIGKSLMHATTGGIHLTGDAGIFYLISLHATQARLDLKNGAYIKAARNGRNAISFVELSRGREHEYEGFYLTSGLYNYMTVQASRKYPFLKVYTLFYPEGDKLRGLNQLRMASASKNQVLKTEAHYFLMRIWLDMENSPADALPHASWLTAMHPENLIYQYYHLLTLKAMHDNRAVQLRKELIIQAASSNPGISQAQKDYFLALILQEE